MFVFRDIAINGRITSLYGKGWHMKKIKKYFKEEFIEDMKYDPFGMIVFGFSTLLPFFAIAFVVYLIRRIS